MSRLIRIFALLLLVAGLALGTSATARAQTSGDNTGKITSGSIPPDGGIGLIVYGGGTFDQLVTASGCPVSRVVFWFTVNGNFVVLVPGTTNGAANAGAQAAFPASTIPANTALLGRCVPVGQSGIQGSITRGPICPVQSITNPCPDAPYQATVIIYNAAVACPAFTCGEVARTTSGTDGQYRVAVAPGTYTVVAQNIGTSTTIFPRPPSPQTVTVPANTFVTVNFSFDTGIR